VGDVAQLEQVVVGVVGERENILNGDKGVKVTAETKGGEVRSEERWEAAWPSCRTLASR